MGIGNHPKTIKPSLEGFDFTKKNSNSNSSKIRETFHDNIDQDTLDKEFRQKCLHPRSQSLPINTATSEEQYKKILVPYAGRNVKKSEELGLNDKKEMSSKRKLHINVAPEHVVDVSNYLTKKGMNHKFLSGGEIEDGKIFTIYIGSYTLTKKIAKIIANDMKHYICKPQAKMDIEFEPGVVGRFAESPRPEGWTTYGTCGFPLNNLLKTLGKRKMELISYRVLQEKYGTYFYTK